MTAAGERTPLVEARGLAVSFVTRGRRVDAVRDVSLSVSAGDSVAIVGESGSGKSVTARALVGLAGPQAVVRSRELRVDGEDARSFGESRWRHVRGRRIGFVLQDAMTSLDPLRRVGAEIAEPLRTHRVVPKDRIAGRVVELLRAVGVPEPEARAAQYPHQLSGGLRQRALIASALAAEPALLIADEPTTALDVTVQAQILDLLARHRAGGTALLLISHDLAVVAAVTDQLLVMRDGAVVEHGPTREVLDRPGHDYTRQLLAAVPVEHAKGTRLAVGAPSGPDRRVGPAAAEPARGDRPVLSARGLVKVFDLPGHRRLAAVQDVSLEVRPGETVGIVGESGSGKSTTARLLLGLVSPDAGTVEVDGRPWTEMSARTRRELRSQVQMVYQDPLGSFDPRYTAGRIVGEALGAVGVPRGARAERAADLLRQVGLSPDHLQRRPRELSGGQRQRLAIARALAPSPRALICDEPVSALDVSVQAQVLDLLADLQERLGLAYVFISHHLGVIYHVSDRVLVMKAGRVVESGDVADIFRSPAHEYTRTLLAAVPRLESAALRPAAVSP
jgi:peptide/nickel transport system ATP-binding protein